TVTGTPPSATPTNIPCTNLWTLQAPYPIPIAENAVTSLNGKIYSFGGYSNGRTADSYVYDPDANAWSAIAPLPSVRESASAVTDGNLIYIIGGLDSAGLTSTIYSYDPTNNTYDTGLA